ncbi:hypothetical protein [Paenibacillus azoreducens]|uniref:hypothetical protein n=1 Tax=Paenibacillus azoreducens TaxID=116718 RepID=UPI001BB3725A|nr:hypothetical protein [Paenibacillus azoreducens]
MEKLEFNQAVGVYTNLEQSGNNVSSFLLFGLALNFKNEIFDTLNNSDISITLSNEKKDEIKFTPEEIKWELSDPRLLKERFSIHLTSDRIIGFEISL